MAQQLTAYNYSSHRPTQPPTLRGIGRDPRLLMLAPASSKCSSGLYSDCSVSTIHYTFKQSHKLKTPTQPPTLNGKGNKIWAMRCSISLNPMAAQSRKTLFSGRFWQNRIQMELEIIRTINHFKITITNRSLIIKFPTAVTWLKNNQKICDKN